MGRVKNLTYGQGICIAKDGSGNDVEFMNVQNASVKFGVSILEMKKGDGAGNFRVPVGQDVMGRVEFGVILPSGIALLTGGTSSTASVKRIRKGEESQTIAVGAITLDNTPIANTERLYGANGTRFKRVASSPAVGEYSISGATCSFNESETEATIYPEYIYSDGAAGTKIIVGPTDLPNEFEMYLTFRYKDIWASSGQHGDMIFHGSSIELAGEWEITAGPDGFALPGFDFHANNDAEGDVELTWGIEE